MINVSRETVSRLMAEFDRAGWVTRDHGFLVVRNRAALEDLARGRETSRSMHRSYRHPTLVSDAH
jgi:DNA-binding GntR family transcriptional regulator